jgi:hypothetical protein
METFEAYLGRKHEELTLLNSFLGSPLAQRYPVSVADVMTVLKAREAAGSIKLVPKAAAK